MNTRAIPLFFCVFAADIFANADPGCPPALRTFHLYERQTSQLSCTDQWQQQLFTELGCPLKFVEGNPGIAQRIEKLQQGEVELITGLAMNRQRNFQFSSAIARNNVYLYRLASAPQWDQINQWCDKTMQQSRILIPAQGYFGETLEKLRQYPGCSKWQAPLSHSAAVPFEALDKQRADLLVSAERHWRKLPEEQRARYQPLALPVIEGNIHLAFSAQIPAAFIQRVNQLITQRQAQNIGFCDLPAPMTTPATEPPQPPV
ncbi:MAG: hypothetical protein U5L02_05150 [Rheinheimera sp.]|nr:hypothetical protein [Rheinheimera sp.]